MVNFSWQIRHCILPVFINQNWCAFITTVNKNFQFFYPMPWVQDLQPKDWFQSRRDFWLIVNYSSYYEKIAVLQSKHLFIFFYCKYQFLAIMQNKLKSSPLVIFNTEKHFQSWFQWTTFTHVTYVSNGSVVQAHI